MNQVFFSYHGETEAEIFHPSTMRDFEFRRDDLALSGKRKVAEHKQ